MKTGPLKLDVSGVIHTLLNRKLITTAGRKRVIGRPIAVSTTEGFAVGGARPLFEHPGLSSANVAQYDVSADGKRFVLVEDVEGEDGEEARAPSIHVIQNWYEEFRERE